MPIVAGRGVSGIAAHRESCPAVTLDLFEVPSAMQKSALRRGDIDAGLLLPPVQADGIQIDELWREDWLIAMPSNHRFADMATVAISDLADENFITAHPEFGPGCHAQSQEMFVAAGVQPPIVARAFRRLTGGPSASSDGSPLLVARPSTIRTGTRTAGFSFARPNWSRHLNSTLVAIP